MLGEFDYLVDCVFVGIILMLCELVVNIELVW